MLGTVEHLYVHVWGINSRGGLRVGRRASYQAEALARVAVSGHSLLTPGVCTSPVRALLLAPAAPEMMVCRAHVAMAAALALAQGTAAQLTQHASTSTTQMSTSMAGYTTYRVGVNFDSGMVQDVYALYGEAGDAMVIPPAFQVAAPFGADVGPVRALRVQLVDQAPCPWLSKPRCALTRAAAWIVNRPTRPSFL